jgi:hypothetical protein
MEYLIHSRSKMIKRYLELITPKMLTDLGLDRSNKCVVITVEKDVDELGLTVNFDLINGYVIAIRSTQSAKEIGMTLAHELVHVRQMATGLLKSLPRGSRSWAGKKYTASTPYYSRPWEIDAFSRQELLFRRAVCDEKELKRTLKA